MDSSSQRLASYLKSINQVTNIRTSIPATSTSTVLSNDLPSYNTSGNPNSTNLPIPSNGTHAIPHGMLSPTMSYNPSSSYLINTTGNNFPSKGVRWAQQLQQIHVVSPLPPSAYFLSPSPAKSFSFMDNNGNLNTNMSPNSFDQTLSSVYPQHYAGTPMIQKLSYNQNDDDEDDGEDYRNDIPQASPDSNDVGINSSNVPNLGNTFRISSTHNKQQNLSSWAIETAAMDASQLSNNNDDWDDDLLASADSRDNDNHDNPVSALSTSLSSSNQTITKAEEWLHQHQASNTLQPPQQQPVSAFTKVKATSVNASLSSSVSSKVPTKSGMNNTKSGPVRATTSALSSTMKGNLPAPPPVPAANGNRLSRSRTPSPLPNSLNSSNKILKRDPSPVVNKTYRPPSPAVAPGIITKESVMNALGPNNPYKPSPTINRGKAPSPVPTNRDPSPVPKAAIPHQPIPQRSIQMAPIRATVPLPSERSIPVAEASIESNNGTNTAIRTVAASPNTNLNQQISKRIASTPPVPPSDRSGKPSTPHSFTTTVYTWKTTPVNPPATTSATRSSASPAPVPTSITNKKSSTSYATTHSKPMNKTVRGVSPRTIHPHSTASSISSVPSQSKQRLATSVRETVEKVADWRRADMDMNPPNINANSQNTIRRTYPDTLSSSFIEANNNSMVIPPNQLTLTKAQETALTLPSSPRSQRVPRVPKATHSVQSKNDVEQPSIFSQPSPATSLQPPPLPQLQSTIPSSAFPLPSETNNILNTSNNPLDGSLSSVVHQLSFSDSLPSTTFNRTFQRNISYRTTDDIQSPIRQDEPNETESVLSQDQPEIYTVLPMNDEDNVSVATTESSIILPSGGDLPVAVADILPLLAVPLPPVPTLSAIVQETNPDLHSIAEGRPIVPVRSLDPTNISAVNQQLTPLPKEYDAGAILRKPLKSLLTMNPNLNISLESNNTLLTGSLGPTQFLSYLQEHQPKTGGTSNETTESKDSITTDTTIKDVTTKFALRGFLSARSPGTVNRNRSPSTGPTITVSPTKSSGLISAQTIPTVSNENVSLFSLPQRTGESELFTDNEPESSMNISLIEPTNTMIEPTRVIISENGFSSVFAVRPRVPALPGIPKQNSVKDSPASVSIPPKPVDPPVEQPPEVVPEPVVSVETLLPIKFDPGLFASSKDTILETSSGITTRQDESIGKESSTSINVRRASGSSASSTGTRASSSKLSTTFRNAVNVVKANNAIAKANTTAKKEPTLPIRSEKISSVTKANVPTKPAEPPTGKMKDAPPSIPTVSSTTAIAKATPVTVSTTPSVNTTPKSNIPSSIKTPSVTTTEIPVSSATKASVTKTTPAVQTIMDTIADRRINPSKYGIPEATTTNANISNNNSSSTMSNPNSINNLLTSIVFSPNVNDPNMSMISQSSHNNTYSTITTPRDTKKPVIISTPVSQIQKDKQLIQQKVQALVGNSTSFNNSITTPVNNFSPSTTLKPRQPTPTLTATTSYGIALSRQSTPVGGINKTQKPLTNTTPNIRTSSATSQGQLSASSVKNNTGKLSTPIVNNISTNVGTNKVFSSSLTKPSSSSVMNSRSIATTKNAINTYTTPRTLPATTTGIRNIASSTTNNVHPKSNVLSNTNTIRATSPTTRLVSRLLSALAGSK